MTLIDTNIDKGLDDKLYIPLFESRYNELIAIEQLLTKIKRKVSIKINSNLTLEHSLNHNDNN